VRPSDRIAFLSRVQSVAWPATGSATTAIATAIEPGQGGQDPHEDLAADTNRSTHPLRVIRVHHSALDLITTGVTRWTADLYVAAYGDASVAEEDWNALKQLADDDVLEIEALALVNRDADGKIHVKDTSEETGKGATIGALGGALVGLIFTPSLLATAAIRTIFAQLMLSTCVSSSKRSR
jgi:hypothetical protein